MNLSEAILEEFKKFASAGGEKSRYDKGGKRVKRRELFLDKGIKTSFGIVKKNELSIEEGWAVRMLWSGVVGIDV